MTETRIVYRLANWKTTLLAILCGLTIVLSPWINKVLYQEKTIYIEMNQSEYLDCREEYQSFETRWRFEGELNWRRPKYIFGVASKLEGEDRETKMYYQAPTSKPIKDMFE